MARASDEYSISVIIPTKNRLQETINAVLSVKNQTYAAKEIIVVDDGSSIQVKRALRSSSEILGYILIETEGTNHPGIARQKGIELAQSKWLCFLDSDDEWMENKLYNQVACASQLKVNAICSNAMVKNPKQTQLTKYFLDSKPHFLKKRELFIHNPIITSTVMIQKSLIDQVNGFEISYYGRGVEDYSTWLKVSSLTKWYFDGLRDVIYLDHEESSIRGEDLNNSYSHVYAMILNLNWLGSKRKKQSFLVRLLYKLVMLLAYLSNRKS
jgi:glycosyltransferase involved in cell wall biosynthesis